MDPKNKRQVVIQDNRVIAARYDMSAQEKDIFYLLLAQLRNDDRPTRVYKIAVKDLREWKGKDIDHTHFKHIAKRLLSRVLSIPLEKGEFFEVNLVSSSEYLKGRGAIEIELSHKIRAFLVDLKRDFTSLELGQVLSLRSKYSKRIYEMLCQYRDTKVFRVSVDELKCRLCLLDAKTGVEKYPKFTWLKKYVLDAAQKELRQKSDITFSYEAIKTGRKYTHLHFKIKANTQLILQAHNTQASTPNESLVEEPLEKAFKKLVGSYQLSPWQARKIVQYVPFKEIHKTTYSIKLEIINNKVHNIGGYTAKVFDQKYELGLFKNR